MTCESCADGTDGYGKCNACGRIIKPKPLMWPQHDEDELWPRRGYENSHCKDK